MKEPNISEKWQVTVPVKIGPTTSKILDLMNSNEEIFALWKVTNRIARVRLHMTDHGIKHFQLVVTNALTMLDLIHHRNIKTSIEKDFHCDYDMAQSVVLLASLLHDIGMSVHREGHEEYSLMLARSILDDVLSFLDVESRIVLRSEVLHAIISHRKVGNPLTLEAGIVRIADALDLTRSRILQHHASVLDIHTVSAQAIDTVEILSGDTTPIKVNIIMNHTAGLFQVDELLKKKVDGSRIERYIDFNVYIEKGKKRQMFKQYIGSEKNK